MSRTRRLLLYLCTAFLTCLLWSSSSVKSQNDNETTEQQQNLAWEAKQQQNLAWEAKQQQNLAWEAKQQQNLAWEAKQQQNLAWEVEQQRRKVALKLACRQWLPKASEYLPKGKSDLQYLLVDDQHKALYCFVPKVGCTNWKRLWMILTGLSKEDDPLDIPEEVPHFLHHHMMLVNQLEDPTVLEYKLDTYKKLIVVRNPYERLLSAYRDKLESGKNSVYLNQVGKEILKKIWTLGKNTHESVTFSEFVNFVTTIPDASTFDEHWRTYHKLCFPCAIKYDVIAKYETLTEDSDKFLRLIGAPDNLHFPPYVPGNTSGILPQYMAELTQAQRHKLYKVYHRDFEAFEYHPHGGPD